MNEVKKIEIEYEPMTASKARLRRYRRAMRRPISFRRIAENLYQIICLGGCAAVIYLAVMTAGGRLLW